MIKNIIFDIGEVLVNFRWREYMADMGYSPEAIDTIGREIVMGPLWTELDLGVRSEQDVFRDMCAHLPEYADEIMRFVNNPADMVWTYPGSREWLLDLKARGYKIYLLSNYPVWLFENHAKNSFDFLDIVDGKVVSAYEKKIKPHADIYELLLSRYGLNASECIFLDDRKANTDAAEALGIRTITVVDREKAKEELDRILSE